MNNVATRVAVSVIDGYQRVVSPWLGGRCRFAPNCSEYLKEAILIHGIMGGSLRGIIRLLRCNPFSAWGYDPVVVPERMDAGKEMAPLSRGGKN